MNVMKLDGVLLDLWVAKSENLELLSRDPDENEIFYHGSGYWHPNIFHPSSDWSHGGSIVANEWFGIEDALIEWFGTGWPYIKAITDAPLKWMMRAYVKSKFGNEVEDIEHLPAHLLKVISVTKIASKEETYRPSDNTRLWPSWLARIVGRNAKAC